MTPDGGNYRLAILFHWTIICTVIIPVVIVLLIAILNPFWFRDDFFAWVERMINNISKWRDYRKYAIYLGTDPKMWHTLKDSNND
jgi:uncharacterized protein involved in cysteine biosynthesis